MELNLGSVKLSVDFGAGLGTWLSDLSNYNDGKWHTVSVVREGVHVKMDIDGEHVSLLTVHLDLLHDLLDLLDRDVLFRATKETLQET